MAEGLLGRLSGRGASSKSDKHFEVEHSDEEWRRKLNPEQYRVLRQHGTERPGTSPLDKQPGARIYHCAACGQPLFDAGTKFNTGTGWPSFWPSPVLSVLAACWIASTARGISASSSTTSIFTLGRKSMTYSAPR